MPEKQNVWNALAFKGNTVEKQGTDLAAAQGLARASRTALIDKSGPRTRTCDKNVHVSECATAHDNIPSNMTHSVFADHCFLNTSKLHVLREKAVFLSK